MYSWEISSYLDCKDYKLNFTETCKVMRESPQIIRWKMDELHSNLSGYGKYHWWTDDGYEWSFYIFNEFEKGEQ